MNIMKVLGGGGFHSNLATCESYDVLEEKWTYIAPMTTYRHALTISSFESKQKLHDTNNVLSDVSNTDLIADSPSICYWYIFAIGGWIDGKFCSAELERYDILEDKWTLCRPMNFARRLLGSTVCKDLIYAFGGNCDDGIWYTNVVEVYNPYTDLWDRLSDMPIAGPTSCVTVDGLIYIFAHGKSVYKYDPSLDEYTALSMLPLPKWYTFDTTSYGNFAFLHGGASDGVWSKAMFRYDTRTDTWLKMPDMLRQRRRTAAALISIPNNKNI